jgi:FAD binding domain
VRLDAGAGVVLAGRFPAYERVDALYSPRRTVLDAILVEAAREAGAEVRENFRVTQVTASGGRVTGIRGSARGRPEVTETASLVIGADGKRSLVAGAVGARRYREQPVRSFASYSYWAGVPVTGGELYQRPGRAVAVFPTNDELTMVYAAAPMTEFASARADRAIRGRYDFTLGLAAFPPATPGQRRFLAAVAADQQETDRFLGAFAGIVPPEQYFTSPTAVRILGSRGIRKLTTATAGHLLPGLWQRDPARPAGARASREPGRLLGESRCGR